MISSDTSVYTLVDPTGGDLGGRTKRSGPLNLPGMAVPGASLLNRSSEDVQAITANFDDLSGHIEPIPNNYMGFDWNSYFFFLNALDYYNNYGPNGYTNGMVSSPNVAFIAYELDGIITRTTDFDFSSASFTAAWNIDLQVDVYGYDDGLERYHQSFTVDYTGPSNIDFNFLSIDTLIIQTSGGVNAGLDGSGEHVAIDNMIFDQNLTPGSIRGGVFNDLNRNQTKQSSEPWLSGQTVYIDDNKNGQIDAGERSTKTNVNGVYSFNNIAPGSYDIRTVVPDWWRQTTPSGPVEVLPGQIAKNSVGTANYSDLTGGIEGKVWHDQDGDGTLDSAEPGLKGWTVFLDLDRNGILGPDDISTVTDGSGQYKFYTLDPGDYQVRMVIPTGGWEDWHQTKPAMLQKNVDAQASGPMNDLALPDFRAEHIEGQLIVKLQPGIRTVEEIADLRANVGATVIATTKASGIQLWQISGMSLQAAADHLIKSGKILYADPNYIHHVAGYQAEAVPNDPMFPQEWGLHNTGQTGGTIDADIDATEAWDITTGSNNVVVGVIDTGMDMGHPDLLPNLYTNSGEIAGNGIDDDGNGFVDDIHGWDFINDDNNPTDGHSHGTHVSGTIGASGNNGVGVTGVAHNVTIMPLKFLGDDGFGNTFDAVEAIEYATMMDVPITNNSWSGGGFSNALYDAINNAGKNGSLFVAAAANSGSNNDLIPAYPSSYDLDNIIAVAATDHNDQMASFSNYGATSVDLAAPGVSILSTTPNNSYASYSGTSMAAPHVSGVAALLRSQTPGATLGQVKAALLDGVDDLATLQGLVATGGRLNAFNSLGMLNPVPPLEVTVTAGTISSGTNFGIAGGATPLADMIHGTEGGDTIDSLGGNDTVFGNGGNDIIRGNIGNDTLNGGDGDDVLEGGSGRDVLRGGLGADVLNGGNQIDMTSYSESVTGVALALGLFGVGGEAEGDTFISIENATGSKFNDIIVGNETSNTLYGGGGNDALLGGRGNDTLYGQSGNDTLVGNEGKDVFAFQGNSGQDTISDFSAVQLDRIWINYGGVNSFSDLILTSDGQGNAIVGWGAGNTVKLIGIPTASLVEGNFAFGPVAPTSMFEDDIFGHLPENDITIDDFLPMVAMHYAAADSENSGQIFSSYMDGLSLAKSNTLSMTSDSEGGGNF